MGLCDAGRRGIFVRPQDSSEVPNEKRTFVHFIQFEGDNEVD